MTSSWLPPVDQSRGLLHRIARWVSKRQYGTVLAPIRILYSRKPVLLLAAQAFNLIADFGLSLDSDLRRLIRVHVARLNGCPFCQDLALARAVQEDVGVDRFRALADGELSDVFTDRERAALTFVTDVRRDGHPRPATREAVKAHFTETEIVELTWLNAAETYFNLLGTPLNVGSDDLSGVSLDASDLNASDLNAADTDASHTDASGTNTEESSRPDASKAS